MKKSLLVFCISAFSILGAQTKTRVQDTLYLADGTKAAGSLNVAWAAFVTADGYTVARSSVNVKIVSGNVLVDLFPTTGATPAGTSYTVTYNLNNTPNYTEYWMVPSTGPVTIGQVRVSPVPTPTTTFGEQQLTLGTGLQTLLGLWKRNSSPVSTGEGQCYWDGLAHAIMCSDATLAFQPLAGGGGSTPDATGSTKGKLKLAGDFGGTADAPTVPGLAAKVDTNDARLPAALNCARFPGADPGTKITNCLAAGPATFAVYDASEMTEDVFASSTITISKPAKLILPWAYVSSASPIFRSSGVTVDIGCASLASPRVSNCTIVGTSPTADFFDVTAGTFSLHDVDLISQTSTVRTAGSGVHLRAGVGATLTRLRLEQTWIGVNQAEGGSLISADHIAFNSSNAQNGAWYALWVMGGCTGSGTPAALGCLQAQTAQLTDSQISYVVGAVDSVMQSGAAYIVDAGVDSLRIRHLEGVTSGPCLNSECGVVFLVQNSIGATGVIPTGVRCTECIFEGTSSNATNPVVKITSGRDIRFHGHSGTVGGTACFQLSPGTAANKFIDGVDISEGTISRCGQEGIKIENPGPSASSPNGLSVSNVRIHGNVIYGASQQSNGTYAAISVAAGTKRIVIDSNHFDEIGSSSAHPNYFVNIAAGDGDEYQIVHNVFNSAFRTVADISDGGTGSNKVVGPNVGTSAATSLPGNIGSHGQLVFTSVSRPGPPALSLVATGTGNVTAGAHSCSVTFLTASGESQSSPGSAPVTADSSHKQITVTVPVSSDRQVTGRNVYCTKAGGTFPYLVAAAPVIANNTATSYTFNTADGSLGSVFAPYFNHPANGGTTAGMVLVDGAPSGFLIGFPGGTGMPGWSLQQSGFNNQIPWYTTPTTEVGGVVASPRGGLFFWGLVDDINLGSGAHFFDAISGTTNAPPVNAGYFVFNTVATDASGGNTPVAASDTHTCWTNNYGNCLAKVLGDGSINAAGLTTGSGAVQLGAMAGSGTRFVKTGATGVLSATPIANADLPAPTASALGGVQAKTCSGTDKLSAVGTDGVPVCSADVSGGAPAWGTITGTLSSQTDLQAALDARFVRSTANTLTNVSAPATPAAGFTAVWTDTTDKTLKAKDSAGVVTTTVKPDAGAGNNFLTAISDAGVISKAQPAFSNLSGSASSAQLPAAVTTAVIGAVFDGGGSTVATGSKNYTRVPYACTITGWSVVAQGSSPTATIDVWKVGSGTALPTVANTITASAKPALSTGNAVKSTTLTGWTTSVAADDLIGFNVDAVSNATWIEVLIYCAK